MKHYITSSLLVITALIYLGCDVKYMPETISYHIHVGKEGRGWIRASSVFKHDSETLNERKGRRGSDINIFADYPLKNQHTCRKNAGNKKLLISYGEFSDIFDLIKIIDSSSPFTLCTNNRFRIEWNGNLLDITMTYLDKEKSAHATLKGETNSTKIVITTDGYFVDGSSGIIDKKGKRITLDDNTTLGFTKLHLIIAVL